MQIGSVLLNSDEQCGANIVSEYTTSVEHTQLGRHAAAKYGLNHTMNVKCKNLRSYDLAFALDSTQLAADVPMVILYNDRPKVLPGGATIPTSLFRDPKIGKVFGSDKRASAFRGADANEQTLLGYKMAHYEYMRGWLQS